MDLLDLLASSAATEAFKSDVRSFCDHQEAPAIRVLRHAPRVKVIRLLAHLLHSERELPIEAVQIDGLSGCSDFRGTVAVTVAGAPKVFSFVWDCQWRAQQEGWVDYFGFPDQVRAAREFGWRCFAQWAEISPGAVAAVPLSTRHVEVAFGN